MRLSPEGARWLVYLRWVACAGVFLATWLGSAVLGILPNPLPVYVLGVAMMTYNAVFHFRHGQLATTANSADSSILLQIVFDLVCLTLILYFSDISRNPFLFYFVFHMFIGGMYLHGRVPFLLAGLATLLVGGVMLFEFLEWIPTFPIRFPHEEPNREVRGLELLGVFAAFATTIWFTVYFASSIHMYVDRAHEELRQKEKMVGIGQLVAGIAHQIANPLDGLENCLRRIGDGVRDDPRLSEYVQMMDEALRRIEKTATRVQAFARPRGIELTSTDVNAAVEATLTLLGSSHRVGVEIDKQLNAVPPVVGDSYTLQEVFFNLLTNAVMAMPDGGKVTITSRVATRAATGSRGTVAVDVTDTGVGIPEVQLDKIFEPFFTTRSDAGGTGLGLGLCRMLVSEMGGRMEVTSKVNRGTTFTVILNQAAPSITTPRSV
jgi:signal transduction histidine kinase